MIKVLNQIRAGLPWLEIEISAFGDKKFCKENYLPRESINCAATKHRLLALYREDGNRWSISTFASNGMGYAFLHERITRPRADFAVYPFFLDVLLSALEETVGVGADQGQESAKMRDAEILNQIKLVKKAIKDESTKVHEPETYTINI